MSSLQCAFVVFVSVTVTVTGASLRAAHLRRANLSADALSRASDKWYICAQEGEACTKCASKTVRFGDMDTKRWTYKNSETTPCGSSFFPGGDVAPGVVKSCECQGERPKGTHFMELDVCTNIRRPNEPRPGPPIVQLSAEPTTMPWDSGVSPLVSCSSPERTSPATESNLHKAVQIFCDAGLNDQVEFFVDPGFTQNFAKLKGNDGWIPRAYVTYVGLRKKEDKIGQEVDLLVQSVSRFSQQPIVVANFGKRVPRNWTSSRFPNMVLMHARPIANDKSFNFNKLRAMMFTKVKTGILVDADQWVNRGFDSIFQRTEDEITAEYPLPIMPVHWLARDPDGNDGYRTYAFKFVGQGAPKRTLRWGHAHPTWTHYALPFLAKWTTYALIPERDGTPSWIAAQGGWEDEDLLNVGLWAENATKQWCKFDIPGYEDYQKYFVQRQEKLICADTKWYPKGIAFLFYSAHAAKDPPKTRDCLFDLFNETDSKRKEILYDGQWFASGKELHKYDPALRCMA